MVFVILPWLSFGQKGAIKIKKNRTLNAGSIEMNKPSLLKRTTWHKLPID